MKIDLHAHSTASDGTFAPQELVSLAAETGLDCLALTDHDTVAGIEPALQAASSTGVELVPGVEVSVSWNEWTVHVLGLNIDHHNSVLRDGLEKLQEFRRWRAREIGWYLEQAGIQGTYEEAVALAKGQLVSRTHFAQVLINRGHAKNMQQVFKRFLVRNKPGYVAGQWAALEQALEWIHGSGGLAVIAHPARYRMSAGKLRQLISEFRELGGIGLEVVSGSHTPQENHKMADYARRYELYASRGSDFHGAHHPWRKLGEMGDMPPGLTPIWQCDSWSDESGCSSPGSGSGPIGLAS